MNRAYSIFHVKSVDADKRQITGIATTPEPDRMGDIIEPLGVSFKNPLPLLLFHDTKKPVGITKFSKPTKDGIEFTATIPTIDEPGTLKDRVDEAWQSIKAGLVSGVSVGFRAIEHAFNEKTGGMHFLQTEVVELSLVTVPANAQATILTVKSLDLAASGLHSPGVSGLPVVQAVKAANTMKTTAEQISAFEATRAAKDARRTEIQTKVSTEGRTKDAAEKEEFDTLGLEIKAVDSELVDLREMEKSNIANATAVTKVIDTKTAAVVRGGTPVITVKSNVPPGTAFTRYVMAKIVGKGSMSDAIRHVEQNKEWMDQTPEVLLMLKAAVNPGTIAEPAWAAPLVVTNPINEFLELLRPATLIGKISNLRKVPFNVSMAVQTGGGTYGWVGEGAHKPVGNLQFVSATLGIAKSAGIIVLSEELAKISTPSAEGAVRNDMIKGMSQFLDQQFIDPTVAAVANVSPASITNAAVQVGSSGTSSDNAKTDIKALVASFVAANQSVSESTLIMSEANAFALATAVNPLGQALFPGMSATGGAVLGINAVTSQAAGSTVALVYGPEILFADDGGVNIDVSREASLQMDTAPTSPPTASTILVNLWQQNLIGLRAERFINWKRARLTAVRYTTATYV